MPKSLLFAFGFVLFGTAAVAQPTMEQRQACEQDAYRFCQDAIPDAEKVRQCLARNMRRLNPGCRSAFRKRR